MKALRKAVRWGFVALAPCELVIVIGAIAGVRAAPALRPVVEAAVLALTAGATALFLFDYRRHRREGLRRHFACRAAIADSVPASVRRLIRHEITLAADFWRWVTRRGPHGVHAGDVPVAYAPAQTATIYGLLFVCVVETVALAFVIPWPLVHATTLVLDVWGCYFLLALHASCVVRPHVVGADGSLRLRYGALLDIRIPAGRMASVRPRLGFPQGKPAVVDASGVADVAVAGLTTVTVELTEPVRYVRVLGKQDEARAFRFYADDPVPAVAALRAAGGSAPGSRTSGP
ncbi:hypothetical protein [Streptomyces sp. A1136]|uniref:hypothetical protein n=1 Tax=Streptomyces sp. A1136 TaxID=2563102 RepID=UPI00109E564A|nr:hypothetical protein [Streptomyces sp. A1136]THA57509.1 hypothetical protein E6R62_06495 [Streptomyces sp. A1136]